MKNIKVTGKVLDTETKLPLANAHVVILCWKDAELESGDVDFQKGEVWTNENGQFELSFEIGFKLDVGSITEGYLPNHYKLTPLNQAENNITIELTRNTSSVDNSKKCENGQSMFISDRTYFFKTKEVRELIGINLSTGLNTDKNQADFWMESEEGNITIFTPDGGGILGFSDSSWEEATYTTPEDGYQNEYQMNGTEKVFRIKLKENKGFGKVFISDKFDSTFPYKEGYYKEIGVSFECVYLLGDSRNLHKKSFDMEEYMLKNL